MFNEIIYPNTQPATDNAEGSIGLVGVYSPSTIQGSLDLSSTNSLTTDCAVINPTTETTLDYSSWIYEPLLAPSALTGLTSNVSPLPIGEIHTLPIGTTVIDPTVTTPSTAIPVSTDPTAIDTSTAIPVSPDVTVTDQSPDINLSTDPVIPVDPTFVSDPIIETGFIATDVTLDPSTAIPVSTDTTATDPSIVTPVSTDTTATDPSIAIPISIDTSTTDPIASDATEYSYYTKDPIVTADPSSIRYLTDRNEPDQSTESPISTDPTITETPVYKDDLSTTDASVLTDSTVNDQSDVTILNYFRPTEINYREISFQPEKSIQLTDTLIVNPTIVAGINLFDLSAGNSISVSPAVTDSSPVSFLIDPSLALGSITETSHIATGKAKK